jgi:hypothetical protein
MLLEAAPCAAAARLPRASRRCARRCRCAAAPPPAPPAEASALFPPLQLGALRLQSCAILSPMESVSDVGFRQLCYAQGAAFTWRVRRCGITSSACAAAR